MQLNVKPIHGAIINCAGKRFGQVTAIRIVGKDSVNCAVWECRCDCGKIINRSRKSFADNERLGFITRCSRVCPAKIDRNGRVGIVTFPRKPREVKVD